MGKRERDETRRQPLLRRVARAPGVITALRVDADR